MCLRRELVWCFVSENTNEGGYQMEADVVPFCFSSVAAEWTRCLEGDPYEGLTSC